MLKKTKNKNYENSYVIKPWGSEYVIYQDKEKIGLTLLKIKPNKETSLHCHSEKKTGFIILNSKAKVQIGIYKKNTFDYGPNSRLVFRPGLFHKLKNPSKKKNLYILELETPYKKIDVIRFQDKYGRKAKPYEGINSLKKINRNQLIFKKPKKNSKAMYNLQNIKITLKYINNSKQIENYKKNSTTAILDGSITNTKNQKIISYGEIIKTETLKILLNSFKQTKKLLVMQVDKK